MITTESEFLEATADMIERRGWTQGQMRDPNGRVCLIGGMHLALGRCRVADYGLSWVAQLRIQKAVGRLSRWNDELDRTIQDVLDLLRRLAKEARQEEESRHGR